MNQIATDRTDRIKQQNQMTRNPEATQRVSKDRPSLLQAIGEKLKEGGKYIVDKFKNFFQPKTEAQQLETSSQGTNAIVEQFNKLPPEEQLQIVENGMAQGVTIVPIAEGAANNIVAVNRKDKPSNEVSQPEENIEDPNRVPEIRVDAAAQSPRTQVLLGRISLMDHVNFAPMGTRGLGNRDALRYLKQGDIPSDRPKIGDGIASVLQGQNPENYLNILQTPGIATIIANNMGCIDQLEKIENILNSVVSLKKWGENDLYGEDKDYGGSDKRLAMANKGMKEGTFVIGGGNLKSSEARFKNMGPEKSAMIQRQMKESQRMRDRMRARGTLNMSTAEAMQRFNSANGNRISAVSKNRPRSGGGGLRR